MREEDGLVVSCLHLSSVGKNSCWHGCSVLDISVNRLDPPLTALTGTPPPHLFPVGQERNYHSVISVGRHWRNTLLVLSGDMYSIHSFPGESVTSTHSSLHPSPLPLPLPLPPPPPSSQQICMWESTGSVAEEGGWVEGRGCVRGSSASLPGTLS